MLTFTPYLLPVVVLLAVVCIILVIRAFVKQEGIPVRAFRCTRNIGKAGGAGGRSALLPEREVSSHLFFLLCRRRRHNRQFGYTEVR